MSHFRVSPPQQNWSWAMIIYLPAPVSRATHRRSISLFAKLELDGSRRPGPRATNPRIDGPAVLPLFCLAPHGVFPASRITPRAVSSYLAISPLPERSGKLTASPTVSHSCQRTGGIFSVTLSVTATPNAFGAAVPALFTRHAAVWCSDFPPANLAIHQRSSAIDHILP